jgi:putative flippase GtrA
MLRRAWNSDKIRYVLIGAYNTAFGYGLFALFWLLWGERLHYMVILVASHILAVINAFFAYRILVFRKKGNAWGDFYRFNLVYLGSFLFNLVALPILVEFGGLPALWAQGMLVGVTVVVSYLLHRNYSFKHKVVE